MTDRQPPRSGPTIGIVGTFDVANFGDLLFPEIASCELERRLGALSMRLFSHRPMASPPWPYAVRPIDELIATSDELDLLIVGGGHLIRFDDAVAPGYDSVDARVPHPMGYWLSPTLVAAASGVPVAWNTLGASRETPGWARSILAMALEATEYVSVRDRASLDELTAVAGTTSARLVPDVAFGIRAVLEQRRPALPPALAARLDGRPFVVVQPSTRLEPIGATIGDAVRQLDPTELAVVELPVSPVLGDRMGALGDLGSDAIAVDPWPPPLVMAAIIAGASAVVAHSLHLSVVALAHGVPVHRAVMAPSTKYGSLATFPGVSTIKDDLSLAQALRSAVPSAPSPLVEEQASQLVEHWDRIAALLEHDAADARARRRRVAHGTLGLLPSLLADADTDRAARLATIRAELDGALAARDTSAAELDDARRKLQEAAASLGESARRVTELSERADALEVGIAKEREQYEAERSRTAAELVKRRKEIKDLKAEVRDLRRKAAALDRLRSRRSYRAAAAVAHAWRGIRNVKPRGDRAAGTLDGEGVVTLRARATPQQERALSDTLLSAAPGSNRTDGPLVSVVITNRNGIVHLRRLLPALQRTAYQSFEVVVVDNGSDDDSLRFLEGWAGRLRLTVLRNDSNRSFSEANNQGAAASAGGLLLFLNNDVQPLGPGWLGHLVDTLEARQATAVGARLVYPRRGELDNAGDRTFPDLSLQHRGIEFVAADGVPTGRNLGTGEDPSSAAAAAVIEAPAVTAASLLVRRETFTQVGGFTEGYVYGTEDVDLALKLRAAGGTIVFDGGAVLWHHEYGTQNALGRDWKRQSRTHNRQLFVDRWAPQAFREVFRDRVMGTGRWSSTPLHVAITLTRDDPTAGWGDYYTAHELGDALEALGWRVSYAERNGDQWYELDPTVDVVIALLDQFDVRRIARGIVTIAWVRNWTERWAEHPWIDEYDIVLASSERSRQIIDERTTRQAGLMPLATNPERFSPRPTTEDLRADVSFVANRWGVRRGAEDLLPTLAGDYVMRVFGRGWEGSELAPYHGGELPYDRLADAYASARVVLDDTSGPTMPYGAVNSRVFDALASGSLVVTDNKTGVRELFGDAFPVVLDEADLRRHIDWARADPAAAAELQARLRGVVLERHTYRHRAAEIRDHLMTWVEAERYAILIGVPSWEQVASWGDYHFARDLQRQFERHGKPTRLFLLDDWNRAASARADVALHLHGLSDHRPRPSQLSLLWIISHPDRITPATCERYDMVFVASDQFSAELAARVRVPVIPLHQATDPDRFTPNPSGPVVDLLFVANSRGVRRAIVDDLASTTYDLAIYGKGWSPNLVDPARVRGDHVPNAILNRYYSSARIVLNDHWPDMRNHGFLSNRLYDALACAACVISDDAVGIEQEFDGAVTTYTDQEDLRRLIDRLLGDEAARRALGEHGRAIVLAHHTFEHRVERILEAVDGLEIERPRSIERWPEVERWLTRRLGSRAGARPEATVSADPAAARRVSAAGRGR